LLVGSARGSDRASERDTGAFEADATGAAFGEGSGRDGATGVS
jgi:hypothetical protein